MTETPYWEAQEDALLWGSWLVTSHFYYRHHIEEKKKGQSHLHFVIAEGLDHFETDLLTFWVKQQESLCKWVF